MANIDKSKNNNILAGMRRSIFGDIDELAQYIRPWDVEYYQVGAGSFRGGASLAASGSMQILSIAWNVAMVNVGGVPPGMRSFAFPRGPHNGVRLMGRLARPNEILSAVAGSEFHLASSGAIDLVVLSLEIGLLERHFRSRFGSEGNALDPVPLLQLRDRAELGRAATMLDTVGCRIAATAQSSSSRLKLEEKIAEILVSLLAPAPRRPPERGRPGLARAVEELLRHRVEDPPSIRELCEAMDVTERTLHHVFRSTYGISPMAYLRQLRLNAVRRVLMRGEDKSVTDAATRFGFFHFGRFSAEYARQFGELPSTTLRRCFPALRKVDSEASRGRGNDYSLERKIP